MSKQKVTAKKAAPQPKMSYDELHAAYQEQLKQLKDAHAEIDGLHNTVVSMHTGDGERMSVNGDTMTLQSLGSVTADMEAARTAIKGWTSGAELSLAERRQLQGAGMRRYGFIDAVSDIMDTNPQFIPSNVSEPEFKADIRKFEVLRNLIIILQQALRTAQDIQLVMGDDLYRQALSYYGAVRDAARRRVPGAQELFRRLQHFFMSIHRFRDEPTDREVLTDVKALLHGRKEGEIIIKGKAGKTVKGERVVIDEAKSKKAMGKWKETESGEVYDED